MQGTDRPSVERKAIVLAAGDHGVAARGVSPYPQDVTWQMVANFSAGGAAINQIAETVGAELVLVDVGVARDLSELARVRHEKVGWGTADLSVGPCDEPRGVRPGGARGRPDRPRARRART